MLTCSNHGLEQFKIFCNNNMHLNIKDLFVISIFFFLRNIYFKKWIVPWRILCPSLFSAPRSLIEKLYLSSMTGLKLTCCVPIAGLEQTATLGLENSGSRCGGDRILNYGCTIFILEDKHNNVTKFLLLRMHFFVNNPKTILYIITKKKVTCHIVYMHIRLFIWKF